MTIRAKAIPASKLKVGHVLLVPERGGLSGRPILTVDTDGEGEIYWTSRVNNGLLRDDDMVFVSADVGLGADAAGFAREQAIKSTEVILRKLPKAERCRGCGGMQSARFEVWASGYSAGTDFEHDPDCPKLRCEHGVLWTGDCSQCDNQSSEEDDAW